MQSQKQQANDQQVLAQLTNDKKKVKKVSNPIPFEPTISLIDVSIKAKSREDQILARQPFLRTHLRRGLSFIQEEKSGATICRRGLQKFFDIKHDHLHMLSGTLAWNIPQDDQKLYKVIFGDALKVFEKGGKVRVYKTEKANGENAQVSYNKKHDAWVVASKNVSILVRDPKDIAKYGRPGENRWAFAKLIAEQWFRILEKVADVEELKESLVGKTLVGEYCGNPKYQHLVEYKEITILFYALVDHQGEKSCLPFQEFQTLAERFKLPFVRINMRKECENLQEFIEILRVLSKEVAENPLEVDQEGSVLYFEEKTGEEVSILSLAKLKTLEYRLYRKLREKLSLLNANKISLNELLHKYKVEVEGLCQIYQPPKDLQHYFEVARIAALFVDENPGAVKKIGLRNRYLSFLKIILKCYEEKVTPKEKHFEELLNTPDESSDVDEDEGGEEGNDEEEDVEEKKDVRKKEEKIKKVVEEEEKKEEIGMIEVKGNEDPITKRVVIITPPLYFDWELRRKLAESIGQNIETDYKDEVARPGQKSIVLVNSFPLSVPKRYDTIFFLVGFEQENLKKTASTLEEVAKTKEKNIYSGSETQYLQSKDKLKSMELLWKRVDDFKQKCEAFPGVLLNSTIETLFEDLKTAFEKFDSFPRVASEKPVKTVTESKPKSNKKQILAFIPIGIPGMGKTTFLNTLKKLLEEKGCAITIISSDVIRRQHMDQKLKANPHMDEKKAFDNSAKPAKKQFIEEVNAAIAKTGDLTQNTHIIFLDKNHPPNIIEETVNFFKTPIAQSRYDMRTVILKPYCSEELELNGRTYPFSLTLLLTCLQRTMKRTNHETLKAGDDLQVASVLLSFFNLYKNEKYTKGSMKKIGADFVMEIPFTHESKEIERSIPETLKISLGNVLKRLRDFNPDAESVALFLQELSKLETELKNPDPQVVNQACLENLNQCFELFQ